MLRLIQQNQVYARSEVLCSQEHLKAVVAGEHLRDRAESGCAAIGRFSVAHANTQQLSLQRPKRCTEAAWIEVLNGSPGDSVYVAPAGSEC